ncbi:MAG: peptidase S9 [Lysobacterales bacterium RIFOXYD1_FULL_69_11]|nr:MAG: peptidase S9 [Xanthomonadales bacterium RIFOXYA1_FULL_69_10]OHE86939.1 MAG: peptidase S9 [Xanthomonadales bacterium RIFOXYD1_FULL_69_11]
MNRNVRSVLLVLLAAVPLSGGAVDLGAYLKKDTFKEIKISPNGDYFAAIVPLEDRTGLVIMRRSDNQLTGQFQMDRNSHVEEFHWVNDSRVLISMAEKMGALAQPRPTGELYAINADGTGADILVGWRVQGRGLGTKIQTKKVERVAAWLVDDLPQSDDTVIIAVSPFSNDPYTRAERMDVYSGRRQQVASAPVRRASFVTDNTGEVRFASGADTDNRQRLYYRAGAGADWELIHTAGEDGRTQVPLGFSEDGRIAYLQVDQLEGPDAIVAFDTVDRSRTEVLQDKVADPFSVIYRPGTNTPVGALYIGGKPHTAFFDDATPEARLYRSLEAAFGNMPVVITSTTADGNTSLVQTWSDRSPGDFYLFDGANKKAEHLLSQRQWFDPAQMSPKKPIVLKARDGLDLHGYLTLPSGAAGTDLPMVVMPHGGPFGIQDVWAFDSDVQMLAQAGYAVLQLNFRGSGGFGHAFESAGAHEWGGTMQDDLTDATRWAVSEGIAARDRICIYGASYGGYAALMGVAKEPDLYRCAVGTVGVYDLPTMHTHGDIQQRGSGQTFLNEWIGDRDSLAAVSPNRMADRIKVPVFLAAGGEDERAPIAHSEMMERALKQAGVPVETLYFPNEGHGFYLEKNRREYYTRLLAFLSRHLGGRTASTSAGGGDVAE